MQIEFVKNNFCRVPFLWHTAKNMFAVSPGSGHTVNNASLPCALDLGTQQSYLPPHLISCVVPTATHTTHAHSLTGRAATPSVPCRHPPTAPAVHPARRAGTRPYLHHAGATTRPRHHHLAAPPRRRERRPAGHSGGTPPRPHIGPCPDVSRRAARCAELRGAQQRPDGHPHLADVPPIPAAAVSVRRGGHPDAPAPRAPAGSPPPPLRRRPAAAPPPRQHRAATVLPRPRLSAPHPRRPGPPLPRAGSCCTLEAAARRKPGQSSPAVVPRPRSKAIAYFIWSI